MDRQRAEELTATIKRNIEELEQSLQEFIDAQAWLLMDYDSFTAWWDDRIGQLRVGGESRNRIIDHMVREHVTTYGELRGIDTTKASAVKRALFSRDQANSIQRRNGAGESYDSLAAEFGCSKSAIARIATGKCVVYSDDDFDRTPSAVDIANRVGASPSAVRRRAQTLKTARYGNGDRYGQRTVTVHATMTEEECAQLDKMARDFDISRSEMLRKAALWYMNRQQAEAAQ